MFSPINEKIPSEDEVIDLLMMVFSPAYPEADRKWFKEQICPINFNESMFIYEGQSLVACYLMQVQDAPYGVMKGLGIRGDALAVHPDFQKQGLFTKFYQRLKSEGKYDYFWGTQGRELNNLSFWSKYRKVINSDERHYYTAGYLK